MAQLASLPNLPTEADAALAQKTSRVLSAQKKSGPLRLKLMDDPDRKTVEVPAGAVHLLVRILDEMARGNAVTLIPVTAEVTTQEAADVLNVSRPSLIQLLDRGQIEFRKVGSHRRVRFDSLVAYKRRAEADRRAVLAELAAYDQELGI